MNAIRTALGPEGFKAFCRGNSIKYLWRYNRKGGNEDPRKGNLVHKQTNIGGQRCGTHLRPTAAPVAGD